MSFVHYYNREGDIVGYTEASGGEVTIDQIAGDYVWPIDASATVGRDEDDWSDYYVAYAALTARIDDDSSITVATEVNQGFIVEADHPAGYSVVVFGLAENGAIRHIVPDINGYIFDTLGTFAIRFKKYGRKTRWRFVKVV